MLPGRRRPQGARPRYPLISEASLRIGFHSGSRVPQSLRDNPFAESEGLGKKAPMTSVLKALNGSPFGLAPSKS